MPQLELWMSRKTMLTQLCNFSSCVCQALIQLPSVTSVTKILYVSWCEQNGHHEKRQAMRVLSCICDVDLFIHHHEGHVSQSWIQFWTLERKPNSKPIFSLLLQGIGQPLIWPLPKKPDSKIIRCYRTLVTFYCESWSSQHSARTQWRPLALCLTWFF